VRKLAYELAPGDVLSRSSSVVASVTERGEHVRVIFDDGSTLSMFSDMVLKIVEPGESA
jgi:hypothetical protein